MVSVPSPTSGPVTRTGLLSGLRVVEVAHLGAGALTTSLADLGADVIKVEPLEGDYGRQMTWPMVEGTSLLFRHINRGKRSVQLDLASDAGVATFLQLVEASDVVVEGMRPGALDRRGLGYDRLSGVNPTIVLVSMSGFGATGPYQNIPTHGVAYDAWAAVFAPDHDDDGRPFIPEHVSIGMNAGPLYGAIGVLAGVLSARATGRGSHVDLAQADAAVAFDWLRHETARAYERPTTEVAGNPTDGNERRAAGTAGLRDGVRYQIYESADGHVLLMASERKFWRNFCEGCGRADLFTRWPGSEYADHARGNDALRTELTDLFRTRTTAEWVALAIAADTAIAPVNSPASLPLDPQFLDRMPWLSRDDHGAELVPTPLRLVGESRYEPTPSPTAGQHTAEVLDEVIGLDDDQIDALRRLGAIR
ncbi:MAG: CaiB/BaiF CoA-transferase family protein [Acidimicrobiales bacterium]